MKCDEIRAMLPAYGTREELPLTVRRHLSRCGDCRSEMARYDDLAAALPALQAPSEAPPASLRAALLAIPSEAGRLDGVRSHVSRNRKTYAGLAVTAVGAAGAVLWRTRRHRLATA